MRKRCAIVLLLIHLTLGMTACVQTNVIEKLGLSVAIGYDSLKKDRILVTTVLQKVDPMAKEKTQVVASTARTSKGARIALNRELAKKLVGGQVRVIIYSKPLASKGIIDLADTLSRDASIGTMIYLTVSEDKAIDLLSHRYPEAANVGVYLFEMMRQNMEGEEFPSATLQQFLRDYYSEGKDPVVPYLKRIGNSVFIKGVALFKNDKMVGKATPREALLIKLMLTRIKSGLYESVVKAEPLQQYMKSKNKTVKLVFLNTGNKPTIKLLNAKKLEFSVSLTINAELLEISVPYKFDKHEALHALEKELGKSITSDTERLIRKLQAYQSDAIGFGEVYRSSVRNSKLTKDQWHEMFKDAKIHVNVKVNFIRTGIIE